MHKAPERGLGIGALQAVCEASGVGVHCDVGVSG
jgi:hypothetical protein